VNRIHTTLVTNARWIGIDLNTTGFAVVAADPSSGHVLKLGKRPAGTQTSQTKDCTKLFREGKMWKLKKMKTRDQKKFRSALVVIARQVVSFAESASAGIKFEKLFSHHAALRKNRTCEYEFSFQNSSFPHLLRLVERRAAARGIPVAYVDPANTSKMCSKCGCTGHRVRKRFECPACGAVIHADVNAALNIAATSRCIGRAATDQVKSLRKKMRREARREQAGTERPISQVMVPAIQADLFLPGRGVKTPWGALSGNEYPAKIPGARP
jgi:IS605 OrfB family transposase